MAAKPITIASYNIHKGMSPFNLRLTVSELRERMHAMQPDVLFLQEVQGAHAKRSQRFADFPHDGQHTYFADVGGYTALYAASRETRHGHHGNAIVTRYRVMAHNYVDISHHRLEGRSMLHAVLDLGRARPHLHCVCVHLGLFARSRRQQLKWIAEEVDARVPADAPLVLAGDFNDWRQEASRFLLESIGVTEVFEHAHGRPARSFPALAPIMSLDRIYARGLLIRAAAVMHGAHWLALSDHAPLVAELSLPPTRGERTGD